MKTDNAKVLFENILLRAKKKFSFSLENFVIMGNHFYLIIRPHDAHNLSKIMQWIMSVYAMCFNRLNGRSGHFWGSRFFSQILDSLQQFLKVFEYIDRNPEKARLVANFYDWLFCGLAHHRFGRHDLVDEVPKCLSMLVSSHHQLLLPSPQADRQGKGYSGNRAC